MNRIRAASAKGSAVEYAKRLLADERVRFLLVGAGNTVFGYALFVVIQVAIGHSTSYFISLYGAYLIATIAAFVAHRRFTFRVAGSGSTLLDLLRFQSVNLVSLGVNTAALPLLVEYGHVLPILAQAIIVIVTTVVSYFGHKFFSFRRPKEPGEQ